MSDSDGGGALVAPDPVPNQFYSSILYKSTTNWLKNASDCAD